LKVRTTLIAGALVLCSLSVGVAVRAQPANPHAEQQLQDWMSHDPRLRADPALMDDPHYLAEHPEFATWLQHHPNVHRQVEEMGAYDEHHLWHEREWWKTNRAAWTRSHHPHWYE
jgi:hypothetical protein